LQSSGLAVLQSEEPQIKKWKCKFKIKNPIKEITAEIAESR